MARPAGLEPTTVGFVDRSSIQLRYGRVHLHHNTWGPILSSFAGHTATSNAAMPFAFSSTSARRSAVST